MFNRRTGATAPVLDSRQKRFPVTRTLARIFHDDEGQDLIEWALIAALISVNSVLAIESVGVKIRTHYATSTATFTAS